MLSHRDNKYLGSFCANLFLLDVQVYHRMERTVVFVVVDVIS